MDFLISKTVHLKRFLGFRKWLILLIIIFGVLTFFAKIYPYFFFDLAITKYIQQYKSPNLDLLMVAISYMGNNIIAFIMIILLGAYFYIINKRKESLMIFISAFGIYAVGMFLKLLIARPRPDPHLIFQMVVQTTTDSFPSGHVLHFVALYGFLIFLIGTLFKKSIHQQLLMFFLFLLILSIGVSRIYLGAHWFSDVLGSYLFGLVWLFLMAHIYHKLP